MPPTTAATAKIDAPQEKNPTPDEIISLAQSMGYTERRDMISATLFFVESNPEAGVPACLINIYYTTRSIMTHLNHPGRNASSGDGTNELWRSNAYDNLEELKEFFVNPRLHTGKGYRNAKKAVRGCVECGMTKKRDEFSKNQWAKGPDGNRCTDCCSNNKRNSGEPVFNDNNTDGGDGAWNPTSNLISGMEQLNIQDDNSFPTLTEDVLQKHDGKASKKQQSKGGKGGGDQNQLERRQFHCPDCPKHGRTSLFFKKVPAHKPICKCPKCKRATQGKCQRLYAVPKQAMKGYGLFKCSKCGDQWGSSRAVANIGQECFSCQNKLGVSIFVNPFRLEKHRKKAGASNRGMKRVPNEPIGEDEVDERGYDTVDQIRNEFGGGAGGEAFSFEPRDDGFDGGGGDDDDRSHNRDDRSRSGNSVVGAPSRVPSGYKHHCAGCASGACKNKKVPFSQAHESDGDTVSTRRSIVTDSSFDKTGFYDRDEDFSGFEKKGGSVSSKSDRDWEEV